MRTLLLSLIAIFFGSAALAADTPSGMRQIESKHLTLVTDVPSDPEVDGLAALFDQAFPQWCAYFGVDPKQHADWHMRGYLMRSPERFLAAGLLPQSLASIKTGYALNYELWLLDQTSPYYRRHLLLHEGTHAFMLTLLNGTGTAWLAEGLAEMLATHQLSDGRLKLNYFPRSRDEVSKWGRIEIVQTAFAERRAMSLAKIFAYGPGAHAENEPYGWCWAAAAFLDGHPRYREQFHQLQRHVASPDFANEVTKTFADDWDQLNKDWQLFVANVDYGYDFARMQIDEVAARPLGTSPARVTVAADRGWQSTGLELAPGQYRLHAEGRYEVAHDERPWMSEPGGVTIRYYHGRPLGMLLAALESTEPTPNASSGLVKPIAVGLETTLNVKHPSRLYLRVNDSAGGLGDNRGSATVEIAPK